MKKGGSGGLPRDITGDALTWRGPNVSYSRDKITVKRIFHLVA
jgi:hypothetical protein